MRKLLISLLLLPISAFAFTSYDNYFCSATGDNLSFKLNNVDSYSVSSNQVSAKKPFEILTASKTIKIGKNESTITCLDVKAGRLNNMAAAQWASDNMVGGPVILGTSYALSPNTVPTLEADPGFSDPGVICSSVNNWCTPKSLNFAFKGTLYMQTQNNENLVCDNVVIGQGSFGTHHNWWVYSNSTPAIVNGYGNTLSCTNTATNSLTTVWLIGSWWNSSQSDYIMGFYPGLHSS